jgi:hypothetical protein
MSWVASISGSPNSALAAPTVLYANRVVVSSTSKEQHLGSDILYGLFNVAPTS